MIPIMGSMALIGLLLAVWFLVKKKNVVLYYLPLIYISIIAFQLVSYPEGELPLTLVQFSSLVWLINPLSWLLAIQFALTGMIGVYSFIDLRQEWILYVSEPHHLNNTSDNLLELCHERVQPV